MSTHSRDTTEPQRRGARPPGDADEQLYGPDLGAGAQIGNYVVEELRSRGGFATVYRARHELLGRVAAVKVLHHYLADSANMVRRFQQEAQVVNRIRHPNIVDIFEFGQLHDGRPYFVMEWLDGRDLEHELRSRGPFELEEALAIFEELCAALHAAHLAGVVHRDLKALNVVLVPSGNGLQVKLVDFGIAKLLDGVREPGATLSTTGVRLGTPWNMAPEQILGQATDARTDVYALGVLLYQVLTGKLPFRAATPVEVEELHLKAEPPRPSDLVAVSRGLDEIIARCLAKAPERRFQSAPEMVGELRRAVSPRAAGRVGSHAARGLALHVQARPRSTAGELDDAVLEAMDAIADAARRACADVGLEVSIDVGSVVLGVALLPADDAAARALARRALEAALAIVAGPGAGAHACAAATLHVASAVVREQDGVPRLAGGDLFCVGDWTAGGARDGVTASVDALAGLPAVVEPIADRPQLRRVRGLAP